MGSLMSKRWITLLILTAVTAPAAFASVFGTVKAIVHDPQHRPVQGAEITVKSRTSSFTQTGKTNEDGIATILNIPVGEYDVTVAASGFGAQRQSIIVTSGNIAEVHAALAVAALQQSVDVTAKPEAVDTSSSTSESLVSRADIAQTPAAHRTNTMSMITDSLPGATVVHYQLSVRAAHQLSWAIDGVPVPNTTIATNVGPQFDPKDVDYVEVQRGSFSAEAGDRTYGVFNVVTRSGFARVRQGEIVASYGTYNTTYTQISFVDPITKSARYFNLHNQPPNDHP